MDAVEAELQRQKEIYNKLVKKLGEIQDRYYPMLRIQKITYSQTSLTYTITQCKQQNAIHNILAVLLIVTHVSDNLEPARTRLESCKMCIKSSAQRQPRNDVTKSHGAR